jgi:hypothetical protein
VDVDRHGRVGDDLTDGGFDDVDRDLVVFGVLGGGRRRSCRGSPDREWHGEGRDDQADRQP